MKTESIQTDIERLTCENPENVRLNPEYRMNDSAEPIGLYVIPSDGGYTCLGFDVVLRRIAALERECTPFAERPERGTLQAYYMLRRYEEMALERFQATGTRSKAELCPQLIGLEGCRVEVVDLDGGTRRFNVGKSTGWMPCHLEIHNSRSISGPAATGNYKSVRVIRRF